MSARSPFFFPSLPSLLFPLSNGFQAVRSQKTSLSVTIRSKRANLQEPPFQKYQVDVATKCYQMVQNGQISADNEPF